MIVRLFALICSILILVSCGDAEKKAGTPAAISKVEMRNIHLREIDSLETSVYGDSADLNSPTMDVLIESYMNYTSKYGGDREKAPEFLYKAAALNRASGAPIEAIKIYSDLLKRFPNYIRNSEAAFLLAFTYDEDLDQKDLAKEAYREVIDKYPGDIWAQQSEERLKTIDMSDEELIKNFMKKNQSEESSE